MDRQRLTFLPYLCFFVILCGLFGLASGEIKSFDLFWQLQSGKYIYETGQFIFQDTFSLAAEVPRHEHCWLHDLIFYGVFQQFGYAGISMFKGLLVALTALFLGLAARARGSSWWSFLLLLPILFTQTHSFWLARPQLWTFLFFALFLWLYEHYRSRPRIMVPAMVAVMLAWANLHAAAVLAIPVLLAYAVGEGLDILLRRARHATPCPWAPWLALALVLLAGIATPYGGKFLEVLAYSPGLGADSGASTQVYNADWSATTYASLPVYYWASGLAVLVLLARPRSLKCRDLLLLGGLFFMGVKLERHTPFLFFALAVVMPVYLDAYVASLRNFLNDNHKSFRYLGAGLVAVMVLASSAYFGTALYHHHGFFVTGISPWMYPHRAVEFVQREKLPVNLFNSHDVGGYLMWRLYPDYQVFIDGRQSSTEMYNNALVINDAKPGWTQLLNQHQVNTIILEPLRYTDGSRYYLIDQLRESPDWGTVYADDSFLVFVRRDAVTPAWFAKHALGSQAIDRTLTRRAEYLVTARPLRPRAYWEAARVLITNKDYRNALPVLKNYLDTVPAAEKVPEAEKIYRHLIQM